MINRRAQFHVYNRVSNRHFLKDHLSVSLPHGFRCLLGPEEDMRPWSWSYQVFVSPQTWCWELDVGFLEEEQVLVLAEPPLHP